MLSDCIFEILVTALSVGLMYSNGLWIAFRLYLWNIGHSLEQINGKLLKVVNCFQIVSLKYWSQHPVKLHNSLHRCELLSDCIFEILVTAPLLQLGYPTMLWIAFRLYLWNIGHSLFRNWCRFNYVVNCFQIVSLKYWSQLILKLTLSQLCCELLSDCIFEILVTA